MTDESNPPTWALRLLKIDGKPGRSLTREIHQELHTAELERLNLMDTLAVLKSKSLPWCICKTSGASTTIVSANHMEVTA